MPESLSVDRRRAFATTGAWWLVCLCLITSSSAAEPDASDEEEATRLPGLRASYFIGEAKLPTIERMESLPAFALAADEAPDARLPSQGWRVAWQGVIEVLQPGRYRFSAHASGALSVTVGDQVVLKTPGTGEDKVAEGDPVDLTFGRHPLQIEFAATGAATDLKLYWESDQFAREPLPPHALGHEDPAAAVVDPFALGWQSVEQHSCVACHRPDAEVPLSQSLGTRPGPKLTSAGSRLKQPWIYHWLGNPREFRPEAVMPQLFADDRQGEIERFAVSQYLSQLGGELNAAHETDPMEEVAAKAQLAEGEMLFVRTGCVVCHEPNGSRPARVTLRRLHEKTTAEALAQFLKDPGAVAPAGLMPGFQLSDADRASLAAYLLTRGGTPTDGAKDADHEQLELPAPPSTEELKSAFASIANDDAAALTQFDALASDHERIAQLARHTMEAKRCTACHELASPDSNEIWPTRAAEHEFHAIAARAQGGCLAASDDTAEQAKLRHQHVPRFASATPREAVRPFLAAALLAPATPAPGPQALAALERFNCTGCHERDGSGGLSAELAGRLVAIQSAESAEAVVPPSLTGVTDKLTAAYLHGVLAEGVRSRPWMSLQMPRFAAAQVASLPAGLATLEGTELEQTPYHPQPDEVLAEAGRQLIGAKGFACTKCHDLLGVASGGTRGPDLAGVPERINHDWFTRWMTNPQRIQPGTRMPTVFLEGRSPYEDILDGDPARQRAAIWQYLLAARDLPYPDGLVPAERSYFAETSRPLVVRTFLPDLTPRAIAIRYPSRQHLAFDAQTCRLAYAWSGGFLDMSPVWTERGGQTSPLEGTIYWTAPGGFPWEVTSTSDAPPSFAGRGADTAFGAAHPLDSEYHHSRVRFRGYSIGDTAPTFRYEYELADGESALFAETITPLHSPAGQGVWRQLELAAPAERAVWLLVGTSKEPPTWEKPDGTAGSLTSAASSVAAEAIVRLDDPSPATFFAARNVPAGAEWQAVERDGQWELLLRFPTRADAPQSLDMEIWRPREDTPAASDALRREIFSAWEHPQP